jgi:hypothetical protein
MGKLANTDKHSPVVETGQPNPEQLNQNPPRYPGQTDTMKKAVEAEKKVHDKGQEKQKKVSSR